MKATAQANQCSRPTIFAIGLTRTVDATRKYRMHLTETGAVYSENAKELAVVGVDDACSQSDAHEQYYKWHNTAQTLDRGYKQSCIANIFKKLPIFNPRPARVLSTQIHTKL